MSTSANDLLNEKEAAAILKVSPRSLQRWRRIRKGPPFLKVGGYTIRYKRSAVEAYLARQEQETRSVQGAESR